MQPLYLLQCYQPYSVWTYIQSHCFILATKTLHCHLLHNSDRTCYTEKCTDFNLKSLMSFYSKSKISSWDARNHHCVSGHFHMHILNTVLIRYLSTCRKSISEFKITGRGYQGMPPNPVNTGIVIQLCSWKNGGNFWHQLRMLGSNLNLINYYVYSDFAIIRFEWLCYQNNNFSLP